MSIREIRGKNGFWDLLLGWAPVSPFDRLRAPSPSKGTPAQIADGDIGDHLTII